MEIAQGRRILIVEDDILIRQEVRQILEQQGFTVVALDKGKAAIEFLSQQLPDLAIIDLGLPDIPGFDVCKAIKRYADIPIIVLTNETHEDFIVMALEQFADDYITKPYGKRELIARIVRVMRRYNGSAEDSHAEMIVDDTLRINFSRHWIEKRTAAGSDNFERTLLTPTESRIMFQLINNAPRVMTIEALLARVWSRDETAYPDVLRVHIRRLRKKVEDDPDHPHYIVTERRLGYRLGVLPQAVAVSGK